MWCRPESRDNTRFYVYNGHSYGVLNVEDGTIHHLHSSTDIDKLIERYEIKWIGNVPFNGNYETDHKHALNYVNNLLHSDKYNDDILRKLIKTRNDYALQLEQVDKDVDNYLTELYNSYVKSNLTVATE